jgi:DNA-binding response OmpR family regulator
MKVLIADDDRILVRTVATYLKQRGFETIPVYDGMQTMMFTQRTKPDVILLDISMPAGNGFQILQKLKASSNTCQIPVVVVSGSVDAQAEGKALEDGADAFVRKPAEMNDLYQVICHALGIPGEQSPKK